MIPESPEVPKGFVEDTEKILACTVIPEAGRGNQRRCGFFDIWIDCPPVMIPRHDRAGDNDGLAICGRDL